MARQTENAATFRKLVTSPVKFRLFMLARLPMAYLAGLRITSLSQESATVSIQYKYLNKNPFNSIYFACLSMAAELSTGVLCMMHIHKSTPPVSMLIVNMKADFTKKALGKIIFTCNDGEQLYKAIEETKVTGEGVTVTATSTGTDESGDTVAVFHYTWSLKAKRK
ncbi:PaaI family thioesterase [Pontibacter toksunensis]|uniref:PaaI family thioesterase n=1 Tax=Pontibacter toksunensis TaxID=1332631 RepID=A0ABW6BTE9_9BACT